MSKLNKILLVAFVLQALLLLGMRMKDDTPMSSKSVQVFGFDPEKIVKLEILGAPAKADGPPQSSVVLSKVNGKWGIGNADDFPADGKKVDELLKTISKLASRTTVLEKATYHDKLEVSAEKYQRRVTLTEGDKEIRFYVGTSPSFKNVHLRLDGKDAVYLVNDLSTNDLSERAYTWVERSYLKFPIEQLWSVKIKNAHDQLDLEKNPVNGEWAVLGNTEPLQKSMVDDLVRKSGTVNLETPVGKALKPEYGLDQPLATIQMVTGTSSIAGTPPPKTENVTWTIGKKLDKENQYYAKASTSEYVVRVAGWAADPLVNKTKKDLVEKKADPAKTPPTKPTTKK